MDKVKALLTPAPAKALAGRELILVTKDVAGTSLCTPEQLSQTCGHQECSWKGSGSLDGPPSDVLPKVALHPAGSMTSRLLAGYFIKCFQQASNYPMQLPLNTGMLHEGWCPAEATRLNSNFRLAQPPRNSAKISLCWAGRSLTCISVLQKLFALVHHWALQTHSSHTLCPGKCHMNAPSGTEPLPWVTLRTSRATAAAFLPFPCSSQPELLCWLCPVSISS